MKKSFVLTAALAAAIFAGLLPSGCKNPANDDDADTSPSLTIKNESSFTLKDVKFSGVSFAAPDSTELPPTSQAVNRLTKDELNKAGYITFTRKDIGIACRTDAVTQVSDQDITVTITDTTLVVETANTDNKKPLGQINFISKLAIEWGGLTVAKNDTVNLGEATLNQTLESVFSIKNAGVGKLLLNGTEPVKITPPVEGFTVVQPASSEVLPDETLTFKINFRPADIKTYNGAVTIDSNDPSGNFNFTINAGGVPPKPIAALFYGDDEIGQNGTITAESTLMTQSSSITITIKNTGSEVLTIDTANIAISGTNSPSFSQQTSPAGSISAGGQSQFIVRFAPVSAGEHNALLTIPCNDSSRNPINVLLQGTATQGAAALELSQGTTLITSNGITPWDFGPVELETNKTVVFTVKNTGNIPLSLTGSPAVESSSPLFTVSTQPAKAEIPVGDSVSFVVRYAPTGETLNAADITIMNNAADGMFTLKVTGNGHIKKPQISLRQNTAGIGANDYFSIGTIRTGRTEERVFTIENTGDANLTFDTTAGSRVNLVENTGGAVTITTQPSSASVSPGGTTSFTLRFAPTSMGDFSAKLRINTNSRADGDFSFTVNGAGGYAITFNAAEGKFSDGTTSKILAVVPGADVRFSDAGIPERSGYAFANWHDGTNYYDGTTPFGPVSSDITYTAQWTEEVSAAPSLTWTGSWTRVSENKYTSNAIGHSANTIERLDIATASDCTVTIQITASSESGYDYGYMSLLDRGVYTSVKLTSSALIHAMARVGTTIPFVPAGTSSYAKRVSGTGVATQTYTVPAGSHWIQFRYQKNGSGSSGSDSVTVEVISINY
ncbi:MAG: choice-of-anchor D domain-containing protein [Treponema sp.]|jgi:archaellum component FlaG (FlaF/FlaG flagellin family)|nr:choice-of-anchor D domain-containing protein [Treponema sp.]